jgi:hypothetical protein
MSSSRLLVARKSDRRLGELEVDEGKDRISDKEAERLRMCGCMTECAFARPRPWKGPSPTPIGNAGQLPAAHNPFRQLLPEPPPSPSSFEPHPEFFQRLAQLAVDEYDIAEHFHECKTSRLVWGKTYTPRSCFLQMCLRDQYLKCVELWCKLDERSRQEFIEVYRNGGASPGYFYGIMVDQEDSHESEAKHGSSDNDSGSFTSRRQFTFR